MAKKPAVAEPEVLDEAPDTSHAEREARDDRDLHEAAIALMKHAFTAREPEGNECAVCGFEEKDHDPDLTVMSGDTVLTVMSGDTVLITEYQTDGDGELVAVDVPVTPILTLPGIDPAPEPWDRYEGRRVSKVLAAFNGQIDLTRDEALAKALRLSGRVSFFASAEVTGIAHKLDSDGRCYGVATLKVDDVKDAGYRPLGMTAEAPEPPSLGELNYLGTDERGRALEVLNAARELIDTWEDMPTSATNDGLKAVDDAYHILKAAYDVYAGVESDENGSAFETTIVNPLADALAEALAEERCPFPGCNDVAEHGGDHSIPEDNYAKAKAAGIGPDDLPFE